MIPSLNKINMSTWKGEKLQSRKLKHADLRVGILFTAKGYMSLADFSNVI